MRSRINLTSIALVSFLLFLSSPLLARTLDYPFAYNLFTADVLRDRDIEMGQQSHKMLLGLRDVLELAQKNVYFAVYGIDQQNWLEEELNHLLARQIKVQAVVDQEKGEFGEWIANNFMYHDTARLPTIIGEPNVRPDQTTKGTIRKSSIMHNKFVVVDERFTWTGSTNLSPTGIGSETHANMSILIDSPDLAKIFTQEFSQMFEQHRFSRAKQSPSRDILEFNDGTRLSAYFSPQDKPVTTAVLPFIQKAKETLDIGMFFLTEPQVLDALENAARRGVTVRLLYDGMAARHPYNYLHRLQQAGIQIKVENWEGKMHLKTAVADHKDILLGSMNWSKSGDSSNDENTLVIENNSGLAGEFINYYNQLWNALDLYEAPAEQQWTNLMPINERELETLEVD